MTNVSLPVVGTHEYEQPRVALRRIGPTPWAGPTSVLLWDVLLAAVGAAVVATTLLAVPVLVLVTSLPVAWCLALTLTRATDAPVVGTLGQASRRVLRAGTTLALIGCAVSTVPASGVSSGDAFLASLTCTGGSLAMRLVVWTAAGARGVRGRPRVVVLGGPDERQHAAAALARRRGPEVSPVAVRIATGRPEPEETPGDTSVALDDLAAYAGRVGACSVVVMPGSGLEGTGLRRLQWLLEEARVPLYVGTGLLGVTPARLEATDVGGLSFVRVHAVRRSGPMSLLVDGFGRFSAAVLLLLVLPALVVLGCAIRRESAGPAVFRQHRVGRDGRVFTMYKLRTMAAAPVAEATALANDLDGVLFKMRSDPRVTPLGRLLRKYSLDELPQLVNVVLGHMRLVGPRPALPDEVAAYSHDMRRRLAVRPGITGLWQVSGRSDLTWEETVRLDLHYVDNWSPSLDLLILCRTLGAVLGHRGAY